MIAKFEEDPPLATKSTGDEKDPNELLAMVSHLNITEGASYFILLSNIQCKDLV